jgi:hypothetical protein
MIGRASGITLWVFRRHGKQFLAVVTIAKVSGPSHRRMPRFLADTYPAAHPPRDVEPAGQVHLLPFKIRKSLNKPLDISDILCIISNEQ